MTDDQLIAKQKLAILNWALSLVTKTSRKPNQVISSVDQSILDAKQYTDPTTGDITTFGLPSVGEYVDSTGQNRKFQTGF